jgi:hypothetical protein
LTESEIIVISGIRKGPDGSEIEEVITPESQIEMIVGSSGKSTVVEIDPSENEIVGFEEVDYEDFDEQI